MNKISKLLSSFVMTAFVGHTISYAQQNINNAQENVPQFLYGIASWYGDDFEGKKTAGGDIYSSTSLTAAHRSLPFGTKVEVENLSNGKKVEVIINDRGPFSKNRILEVSKQAAEILDIVRDGTGFVKVSVLEIGTGLASPMQPAEIPMKQDIPDRLPPQNYVDPVVASDDDFDALFADADDEINFMDSDEAVLTSEDTELKTQAVPTGFNNVEDGILIDDPLANLTLGEDEEFVPAPVPARTNNELIPTQEEENLVDQESMEDPFADLFDGAVDPYQFQSAVNDSAVNPLELSKPIAPNIDSGIGENIITNIVQEPLIVTVTNYTDPITNVVNIPSESMSASTILTPPATPQTRLSDHYVIQLGAFSKQSNALGLYERLRNSGFNAFITDVKLNGKNIIRVRVGYFSTVDEAVTVSDRLRAQFSMDNRIIQIEYDQ